MKYGAAERSLRRKSASESSPLSVDMDDSSRAQDDDASQELARYGSSVRGATFNFVNSIVGAGAIGLGGAIASSGGLVGAFSILFFALLTKFSFDLVIDLSVTTHGVGGSYEELGRITYGNLGHDAVLVSKFLYSFGCLVAYIVIIKDNFSSAMYELLHGQEQQDSSSSLLLDQEDLVTWFLSGTVVLPLCLLRNMTLLENFSLTKIFSVLVILGIVMHVFFSSDLSRQAGGSVYKDWFQIRPAFMESLGTFVFTFVSQHNVHQVYHSLRPELRTVQHFGQVSTWAVLLSTAISIALGLFVYMTFWESTTSAMFEQYPSSLGEIHVAKLLLCVVMMLTFPLPFFACRELVIVSMIQYTSSSKADKDESIMANEEEQPHATGDKEDEALLAKSVSTRNEKWWLLYSNGEHEEFQLILPCHVLLTVCLWGIPTFLAIAAPSLGDVLNLVGAATGTLIAFVLPALFCFRLRGHSSSVLAWILLIVGGIVGMVGTFYSIKRLYEDVVSQT